MFRSSSYLWPISMTFLTHANRSMKYIQHSSWNKCVTPVPDKGSLERRQLKPPSQLSQENSVLTSCQESLLFQHKTRNPVQLTGEVSLNASSDNWEMNPATSTLLKLQIQGFWGHVVRCCPAQANKYNNCLKNKIPEVHFQRRFKMLQ